MSTDAAAGDRAKRIATELIAPNVERWGRAGTVPRDFFLQAAEAGLCGLLVPRELGGQQISFTALMEVMETLAYADLSTAFALVVHNNHARAIALAGTDAQRARWLPDMLAGRTIGAFLLTEPHGGSDAADVHTTAERTENGWRIQGEKAWVTNARHADLLNVFAQTDASAGSRGVISVQVPATADGVYQSAPYEIPGGSAMGVAGFTFDNAVVDADHLLVGPGPGFRSAMAGIDIARTVVAAMCCGLMQASLDCVVERLRSRSAFGQTLAGQQGLRWKVADVATDLHATRLMAQSAAAALDQGKDATLAAAHAKKFAADAAFKAVANCMQAMGADGLKPEFPLARHLTAAKIAGYIDGTSEIQNVVISRALLDDR